MIWAMGRCDRCDMRPRRRTMREARWVGAFSEWDESASARHRSKVDQMVSDGCRTVGALDGYSSL